MTTHGDDELRRVYRALENLADQVSSLDRAVRGAPEEGNRGVLAEMQAMRDRGTHRHKHVDTRLERLERAERRRRIIMGTVVAIGSLIGSAIGAWAAIETIVHSAGG